MEVFEGTVHAKDGHFPGAVKRLFEPVCLQEHSGHPEVVLHSSYGKGEVKGAFGLVFEHEPVPAGLVETELEHAYVESVEQQSLVADGRLDLELVVEIDLLYD